MNVGRGLPLAQLHINDLLTVAGTSTAGFPNSKVSPKKVEHETRSGLGNALPQTATLLEGDVTIPKKPEKRDE